MSDTAAAVAPKYQTGQVRPLVNRFTPAKWVLYAYMAGEAGLFAVNCGEMYYLLGQGVDLYVTDVPFGGAIMGLGLVAGILQFVALIASYVLVSMWTYRAMKNLHVVGEPHAEMSPGWAVGWYFIPFANFVKPFQGMLEIWRGSHHQAGESEKVPAYVGWWWAFWLGSNILANISVRLGGWLGEGEEYGLSLWFFGASSLAAVVCGWLLLKVMGRITGMQARMSAGGLSDVFS